MVFNPQFWALFIPLIVSIGAWYFNERVKRQREEYARKEQSYRELLLAIEGFYVETQNTELKNKFLKQVSICWLFSPDDVINKAYAFLDTVKTDAKPSQDKERAFGELVLAARQDLLSRKLVKHTKLRGEDFRHFKAT
jgi:uncharacterized protein (DUF2225 family)